MTLTALEGAALKPGRRALLLQVVAALVVGSILSVLVVLPAEYGVDPTGFGKLVGLTRISAPPEVVVETRTGAPPEIARAESVPFRTDDIIVTIPPFFENFGALEYKVTMQQGQTLIYSWSTADPIIAEFHGHTIATPENPTIEVMNYIKGTAAAGNGTLVAPVDGIHGWYFAQSGFEPLEVTLHLAGFYTLEPGLLPIRPSE